jgi:hypothetical protein
MVFGRKITNISPAPFTSPYKIAIAFTSNRSGKKIFLGKSLTIVNDASRKYLYFFQPLPETVVTNHLI